MSNQEQRPDLVMSEGRVYKNPLTRSKGSNSDLALDFVEEASSLSKLSAFKLLLYMPI